jgi:hypothetical protein
LNDPVALLRLKQGNLPVLWRDDEEMLSRREDASVRLADVGTDSSITSFVVGCLSDTRGGADFFVTVAFKGRSLVWRCSLIGRWSSVGVASMEDAGSRSG